MEIPRTTVRAQGACFSDLSLLCARHEKGSETYWVLPGGHLDPGESVWDALVREMREETGLILRAGHLWALSEFRSPGRHVLDCTFFVTDWSGMPRLGHDPEANEHEATLVELAWLSRGDMEEARFLPTVLGRHLRAHWGDPDAPTDYLGSETV